MAQESAGEAEIGFQQYYLSVGSQRVVNVSGLTLNYSQFIPDIGLLSAGLAPAVSSNRFRTGDEYLRLNGLPWKGEHWNFNIGDFRLPGQLLTVPFTNVYTPDIAARGAAMEASHGGRTFGFFYGTETISNTPRVVLRLTVPQTLAGFYVRQKVGKRLVLGARVMRFSNDLVALRNMPNLLTQGSQLKSATTISADALFTVAGQLKWYSEVTWSPSVREGEIAEARHAPISILIGPILETKRFKLRANYTIQDALYFPLLGYYLGDRRGPFGEVAFRPVEGLEIYASASAYQNNIVNDPMIPTFRNSSESTGASLQLPGKVSVNVQLTLLDLSSRQSAGNPWDNSKNRQETVTLARAFSRHNLRLTARDFRLTSPINPQVQRSGEVEDSFHFRHLVLGAGVKVQRLIAGDSRTSLLYHGLVQFNHGPFSAYANFESGNDLQNRTLLATNTISTTVVGASLNLGSHWEFQAEAYRNNLTAELNPGSIFVLQGQGVFVPGTIAALNQWSIGFHVSRRFHWGKAGVGDPAQLAATIAPLKGTLDGFVMERLIEGNRPAEGVPVSLDQNRTAETDAEGRFHFPEVPEGIHKVALALQELPAEFDPGPNRERTVAVYPSKAARGDLDVVRLGFIQGKVTGPMDVAIENIVIRMVGTERYTTPGAEGDFYFYNLREGEFNLTVDHKSLPEYAVIGEPDHVSVSVRSGATSKIVAFHFEVHKPQKSVRTIFENTVNEQPPPTAKPSVMLPAIAAPLQPVTLPLNKDDGRLTKTSPSRAIVAEAEKHQLAGRQLTKAGRYREAIEELSKAILLSPDSALAYNARGLSWYLVRNYGAAIEDLSRAIRLNTNYANAYQIRSLARKAAGDASGAAEDLKMAKKLGR